MTNSSSPLGKLALVAEAQVDKLIRASRWHRVWIAVIASVTVLTLAACVVLGVVAWQAHDTGVALKNDSIASCEQSNAARALDQQVWDSFIQLLLKGNKNSQASAEGAAFEQAVAKAYAPKDCVQAYSNVSGIPASATQLPGDEERTDAVTSETAELKSWDGACLSIPNANAGTAVDQVSCSSAHAWTYYSTGQLSPQGHSNVEVGDSGGHFVLKATGSGTDMFTDDLQAGPGGYYYDELYFGVTGTYWHANGAGQVVTFDNQKGDHANYWVILSDNAGGKAPQQVTTFNVMPRVV